MKTRRINVTVILSYLVFFCIVLNFGGMPWVANPIGFNIMTFFIAFTLFLIKKKLTFHKKTIIVLLLFALSCFFHYVITQSPYAQYVSLIACFSSVCFIFEALNNNLARIKKILIDIIWLVMYMALINFIIANTLPSAFYPFQSEMGMSSNTIMLLFNYGSTYTIGNIDIYRNQSLFWEPGVLQIVANILVYYILIEERKNIKEALLPIIIVISTFSTTGYIILFFIFLMKYKSIIFSRLLLNIKNILAILIISLFFIPQMLSNIENKTEGNNKWSYMMRMYDLMAGSQIIASNPIFGIGLDSDKIRKEVSNMVVYIEGVVLSEERGNTNSLITVFAMFGIPIGLLYCISLYKQRLFIHKKTFFIIIIISLSSEPLPLQTLVLLLLYSSIRHKKIALSHEKVYSF